MPTHSHSQQTPVALTIAGSDSGGGAGIQADLKTFRALRVHGTSAITCITAQNPDRVSHVQSVTARVVIAQIERILEAFPVRAAKTGMLYDRRIIVAVAGALARVRNLVVDPVMVATSGAMLLRSDAVAALECLLIPRATVVTPNIAEAEALLQGRIATHADLRAAAQSLYKRYRVPFLVKGGHLTDSDRSVDVLYDGRGFHEFAAMRVRNVHTHGTGCTYSAAITANLARGMGLIDAIRNGKRFVTRAIRTSVRVGKHHALNV